MTEAVRRQAATRTVARAFASAVARAFASAAARAVALVAVCLICVGPALAQDLVSHSTGEIGSEEATAAFHEANALYAEGRHGEAAAIYEAILASGFSNAEVYYNLANARYMDGDIGKAVLGFERSLRLDGSHEDAAANLEFVREQLADRQVRVGGAISDAIERLFSKADVGRVAMAVSLFYFIVVGCLIAGTLRGAFNPWLTRFTIVMTIHLVVAGGILAYRVHRSAAVKEAVIIVTDVPVRTGPGDDFVLEFRLHEGTKVRLREARDDWARVSVEGTDLEGWLPGRTIEEI